MLNIYCGLPRVIWNKVLEDIRESRERGEKILLLVPEQYTLDTERRLIRDLKLPGFFDMEVLSPRRLCTRVFERAGRDGRVLIDRCGRQMALSRVLEKSRESLKYYQSAVNGQGFTEKLGVQIAQLKQAGVTPEMLEMQAEACENEASRDKYADLALIFGAYEDLLSGQFMDGEDENRDMLSRLRESGVCDNASVFVYGFDMITEQLAQVIARLALFSEQVNLYPVYMQGESLFSPVLKSLDRLSRLMAEQKQESRRVMLSSPDTGAERDLLWLQEHLPRGGVAPMPDTPEHIYLRSVPNGYTEMHLICAEMLRLNKAGMPFRDMALVLGDTAGAETVKSVTAQYNIPIYIASKLPAASHGASRFLLSSLRALDGFMPRDVIGMIKSGYSPLTEQEGWQLEIYIGAYGIRGSLFTKPFSRGKETEYVPAEELRLKLLSPLLELKKLFDQKKDCRALLTGVFEYLETTRVYEKLEENKALLQKDHPELAVQCGQVWSLLIQLLDQADSLLSGMTFKADRLSQWLEAGLKARELSALPPSADCAACGDLGNIPLSDKRAVFAAGLCDSLLSPGVPPLLEDAESAYLEEKLEVHLSLSGREQDRMRFLDLWKTFSAPSEALYLSYPLARQDGTALRPVSVLTRVRELFPDLRDTGGATLHQGAAEPLAPRPVLAAAAGRMREGPLEQNWQEAWNWLCESREFGPAALRVRQSLLPKQPELLPPDLARELYMGGTVSISRLETFAACPFKHFVEHGLKPAREKKWTLEKNETGDFYHKAIETFTAMLPQLEGWPYVKKAECDALMDRAVDPLLENLRANTAMADSKLLQYTGEKYRKMLRRVAWAFTRGARNSAFRPDAQELSFGFADENSLPALPIRTPDGQICYLQGRIDRVDRYEGDEGIFLRVVDYKSSGKTLDPSRIWYGQQLQLLLYLSTVLENEKNAEPAGCFYFHVDDPLVEEPEDLSTLEDLLAEEFQLKGIALKDAKVIRLMDSGESPRTLPRLLNKDGNPSASATLASLEEMRALLNRARAVAGELAGRVLKGETAADPSEKPGSSPCTYCDYRAVCRRDPGDKIRELERMNLDELIRRSLAAEEKEAGKDENAENM